MSAALAAHISTRRRREKLAEYLRREPSTHHEKETAMAQRIEKLEGLEPGGRA